MAETKKLVFGPCSEKQRLVLTDNDTDILLVGGGAGGGKSRTCLTKYLPALKDPYARIVVFRQTRPQLVASGGLVDESKQIYPHFGGVFKSQAMKWIFPSGATIQFAAIGSDRDLPSWQGSQLTHVLVDEAAEWTEAQVVFLLSRMRSANFKGKLQCILSCNPSKTSFLYKWVEWCLDDRGIPKEGTEDITRWFVNLNGKTLWGDSAEELYREHGKGFTMGVDFNPVSFRFIPMTVYDNPILLKANPQYLSNLLAQPRVNQLRYLHGSWTAQPDGAGYFKREWCEIVDYPPVNPISKCRGWDLASTVPNELNRDPDYTAGVLISRDKYGMYYVEDVHRFRKRTGEVIEEIVKTGHADGADRVRVVVPKDPGAAGASFNSHLVRILSENGLYTRSNTVNGHSGKVQRFLPLASLAESGNLKIVRGEWNEEFLTELEAFDGSRKNHDDMVDAASDAFNNLARELHLPAFVLPDFSRQDLRPKQ